jgi:hypothetical protein
VDKSNHGVNNLEYKVNNNKKLYRDKEEELMASILLSLIRKNNLDKKILKILNRTLIMKAVLVEQTNSDYLKFKDITLNLVNWNKFT